MPRPKLIRSDRFAYHVYVRSNNKEWFYIPIEECWRILLIALNRIPDRYRPEVHALVLMSNHLHMILSAPNRNLDAIMMYFLSDATRWIQNSSGRINHIFGGRYGWSLLEGPQALAYAYKYIYRNPVRAGLCDRVEDYPFSTLNTTSATRMVEGFGPYWRLIPRNFEDRLAWLNKPTPKEGRGTCGESLTAGSI